MSDHTNVLNGEHTNGRFTSKEPYSIVLPGDEADYLAALEINNPEEMVTPPAPESGQGGYKKEKVTPPAPESGQGGYPEERFNGQFIIQLAFVMPQPDAEEAKDLVNEAIMAIWKKQPAARCISSSAKYQIKDIYFDF